MGQGRNQVRAGHGRRRGADRGGRMPRRYALAGLGLTFALLCGLAGVANAAAAPPEPPPSNLTATAAGGSEADLTWAAPATQSDFTLAGYDVYQGTSSGAESATPLNSTPVTATSYTVSGLDSGTTYYFVVTAVYLRAEGGDIPSPASNEAVVPAAPAGLTAAAAGSSQVDLTWDAATAPADLTLTGYDIYQGTSSGGESAAPLATVPATAASYTVPGLDSGTTYYFTVTAVYGTGQSPASIEASATTENSTRPLEPQVVRFGPLATRRAGVSFTVAASASSGLPVSFSSDTPHVCAVSGSTVRTLAAGRCEIRASQGGNASFQSAADVVQGFTVSAAGVRTASPTPAAGSTGPGALVVILLTAGIIALLAAGVIALLAAGRVVARRRPHPRPLTTQAASVRAERQQGPPAAVHLRVTGPDPGPAVRIEPRPGTRSTTIEEVQS